MKEEIVNNHEWYETLDMLMEECAELDIRLKQHVTKRVKSSIRRLRIASMLYIPQCMT